MKFGILLGTTRARMQRGHHARGRHSGVASSYLPVDEVGGGGWLEHEEATLHTSGKEGGGRTRTKAMGQRRGRNLGRGSDVGRRWASAGGRQRQGRDPTTLDEGEGG
jgi:hypothetical protein